MKNLSDLVITIETTSTLFHKNAKLAEETVRGLSTAVAAAGVALGSPAIVGSFRAFLWAQAAAEIKAKEELQRWLQSQNQ